MPAAPEPTLLLERRLEDNASAWVKTLPQIGTYAVRESEEDTVVSPEGTLPAPVIIVKATDEGRAHKLTPIRNIKLSFIVRANSKTPGGSADSFPAIGGTLESFLDTTNLVQAFSGPTIGVMLVTRVTGIGYRTNGLVKEGTVSVDCKCVAAELTTGGTGTVA